MPDKLREERISNSQQETGKAQSPPIPLSEVVSSSGEVQNKLFATPPGFGRKLQTGGRAVTTSDLIDNTTSDRTPDLFSFDLPSRQELT